MLTSFLIALPAGVASGLAVGAVLPLVGADIAFRFDTRAAVIAFAIVFARQVVKRLRVTASGGERSEQRAEAGK